MAKVSVIVPVYKVEEFLEQCVDSVLKQTYENFELILVDDGSPDQCPEICDRYAQCDARVKVIHKENGGLSSARNAGIAMASGEFVFYLDSDDFLDSRALESLVEVQAKTDADLVAANYFYAYTDHKDTAAFPCSEISVLTREAAMELLVKGSMQNFAWGKLIRTAIAKEFLFPEGKLFEDHFWAHHIVGGSNRIVLYPLPILYYRQREGSISYSFALKSLDMLDGWSARRKYLEENFPALVPVYMSHVVEMFLGLAWQALRKMRKDRAKAFAILRDFSSKQNLERYAVGKQRVLLGQLKRSWILYSIYAVKNRLER